MPRSTGIERLLPGSAGGKIEAVGDHRQHARRPRRQPAQIKRQPFAQQFQPRLRLRLGISPRRHARLRAVCLRHQQARSGIAGRIMAQTDRVLMREKREHIRARRPLARGKQQMKPCNISVRRR
jgi:hypothetical protein